MDQSLYGGYNSDYFGNQYESLHMYGQNQAQAHALNQSFNHTYNQPNIRYDYIEYPTFHMVPPTWHRPTFVFALIIIVVLVLGLWFGKRNTNANLYGGSGPMYW